MICHTNTRAHITHQLATLMLDVAFITKGYINWKDATRKKAGFSQLEISQCHREAEERSITLHATTSNAGEHISSSREEDNDSNIKTIVKIKLLYLTSASSADEAYRCVVTGMEIILTSHRLSTFELKPTCPFHVVGQENQ